MLKGLEREKNKKRNKKTLRSNFTMSCENKKVRK